MKLAFFFFLFIISFLNLVGDDRVYTADEVREKYLKHYEDRGVEVYTQLDRLFQITVTPVEKNWDFDSNQNSINLTIKNNFKKSVDISPLIIWKMSVMVDNKFQSVHYYYQTLKEYKPIPFTVLKPNQRFSKRFFITDWLKQYKQDKIDGKEELLRNENYSISFRFVLSDQFIRSNTIRINIK
jgi:hypothetical protein